MAITVAMRAQVAQLYAALFGRAPDADGLGFWAGKLGDGASLASVAQQMFNVEPARAYYPSSASHADIITSFYNKVLGRSPDTEGLDFWTAKLDASGATPGSVIAEMISVVVGYTGSDPAGLASQALFANKVAVAQHYAEAGGPISGAAAILNGITSDPATAAAAIAAIDHNGVDAPIFNGASVNGSALTISYADAGPLDATHLPPASAFAVTVNGSARAVTGVEVNAAGGLVTLTLASGAAHGEAVTVAYTDPTASNDTDAIQDATGHDAATLAATSVANATPAGADIAPPVFASASVSGSTLVMTYTDAAQLDAAHGPAAGAFAVSVGGEARAVTAVALDAAAKTVTLTLASAVVGGQSVTVAYTDPSGNNDVNALQDTGGNDAATLAATAVASSAADVTGPRLLEANVDGATLSLGYDEPLDDTTAPGPGAFNVTVGGVDRGVLSVSIDAAFERVILTLASPVLHGEAVTVAYNDPTSGNDTAAIQDLLGNDSPTMGATAVTNLVVDAVAPVFASAVVTGNKLVMKYTEQDALDAANIPPADAFVVRVAGVVRAVGSVAVNASLDTVTLTLASAVTAAQAVTVAYTDPSSNDNLAAIQDASGNDAASLGATTVTNITGDATAPVFTGAAAEGTTLVLTYSDTSPLDATHLPAASAFTVKFDGIVHGVNAVAVDPYAMTVTLALADAVEYGQVVTVAYKDPGVANDSNAIQDINGNDAATLAATVAANDSPAPDVAAPEFVSAAVDGDSLVMSYSDESLLDAGRRPLASAFHVLVDSVADAVGSVLIDASAKTVRLTLSTAVLNGQVVTVAYTDPTPGDDAKAIQDQSGNDAASLGATAVVNETPLLLLGVAAPDAGLF
jgi:uncharacterized repeat protein (TIGR02059 family)